MTDTPPGMGQTITTFSFILFGVLLGLAAAAEPSAVKSAALGLCAALSFLGALRFRIQSIVTARSLQQRTKTKRTGHDH